MSKSRKKRDPDWHLLMPAHESQRTVSQMLKKVGKISVRAAKLRARAVKLESAAATLHEDSTRQQALMQTGLLEIAAPAGHADDDVSTALSDMQIIDASGMAGMKPPGESPAFKGHLLPTQDRIEKARRTKKLLEHTGNKAAVSRAKDIRNSLMQHTKKGKKTQIPKECAEWAADVLAWADVRRKRLQEAYAVLARAREQARENVLPPTPKVEGVARKSKLAANLKAVVLKKDKRAIRNRKSKGKHTMKTRSKSEKTSHTAHPQSKRAEQKRHQHDVDLINDPIWGPLIAASQEQAAVWLATRKNSRLARAATPEYFQTYDLSPRELPMMSGTVLTSAVQPNVETHTHVTCKQESAVNVRGGQLVKAEEDRIKGMSTDDGISYDEPGGVLPAQMRKTNFFPEYVKGRDTWIPMANYVPLEGYFDNEGRDTPRMRHTRSTERRSTNDLLWDID